MSVCLAVVIALVFCGVVSWAGYRESGSQTDSVAGTLTGCNCLLAPWPGEKNT